MFWRLKLCPHLVQENGSINEGNEVNQIKSRRYKSVD